MSVLSLPRARERDVFAGLRIQWSPVGVIGGAAIALAILLCLYPTAMLIRGSLTKGALGRFDSLTLSNYAAVYGNPETYQLFGITLLYAAAVAGIAVLFGLLLAWIAVRTDSPLAGEMGWLVFIPYAIPGTLTSIGWILLANPNTGFLNVLVRNLTGNQDFTPFNVYSFLGMVFVSAMPATVLAFTFLAVALRAMDPAFEEAGSMSGSGPVRTGWRVSLPLIRPAVLSMLAILLILGLESFDVPAFVGIPAKIYVFTTEVFIQARVKVPPDFGMAATYGILPLALALLLTFVYQRSLAQPERYATISGKAFRPRRIKLGPWRWLALAFFLAAFFVSAVLPLLTLLAVALAPSLNHIRDLTFQGWGAQNFATIVGDAVARRAIRNSILLAVLGATSAMLMAFFVAYVNTRTKLRGRGLIEYLLFLPFAFPSIVLAIGVLWGYIRFPIAVYATVWIMMIGYVTKFLPYGLRSMSGSMLQVHRELEESAKTSGATLGQALKRVIVPLTAPGFIAGWSLLVVVFLREFSMSLVLWSSGSEVVTVLFYDYWTNGRFGQLGALGMLLIVISLALVLPVRRLLRVDAVIQ
jgi:iron(III) transport system permease protein